MSQRVLSNTVSSMTPGPLLNKYPSTSAQRKLNRRCPLRMIHAALKPFVMEDFVRRLLEEHQMASEMKQRQKKDTERFRRGWRGWEVGDVISFWMVGWGKTFWTNKSTLT